MAADSAGDAFCRMRSTGAPDSPSARSSARSLRGSNQIAGRPEVRPLAAELHRGVVLARHHVGVRDHHAVRRQPAAALHAEPASRAQDLHHAAARPRRTSGSRAIAALGGPTSAVGPVDLRERVEARERVDASRPTAAGARSARRGSLERWIGSRSSRAPPASEGPRPRRPRPAQAEAGHEHGARHPVEHVPRRRPAAGGAAGSRAPRASEARIPPTRSGPDQREQRRVGRLEPPRAAEGPGASRRPRRGKPAERQCAHDQALCVTPGAPSGAAKATMIQSSAVTAGGRR